MASSFESRVAAVSGSATAEAQSTESELMTMDLDAENYTQCTDGRYLIYGQYSDTDYSTVDTSKDITMSANQINITQEQNSQYIPFRINRYYDGIDLMNMYIQIRYENSSGKGNVANAVNVQYSVDHIIFGWLVDGNVTAKSGEIRFELMATGTNEKGNPYTWRTKPNGKLTILEALNYDGIVEPTDEWYTSFVNTMLSYVAEAKGYADNAEAALDNMDVDAIASRVEDSVSDNLSTNYYNKVQVDQIKSDLNTAITSVDSLKNLTVDYDNVSGALTFFNKGVELDKVTIDSLSNLKVVYTITNGVGTLSFLNGTVPVTSVEIGNIDPSTTWTNAFHETITTEINAKTDEISNVLDGVSTQVSQNTQKLESIDNQLDTITDDVESVKSDVQTVAAANGTIQGEINTLKSTVNGNSQSISDLSSAVDAVEELMSEFSNKPSNTYDIAISENVLSLYENDEIKTQVTLPAAGGGGGSTSSSTITIERITEASVVSLIDGNVIIEYSFSSIDNVGDATGNGTATWKVGNTIVATSSAIQGNNAFDITKYLKIGENTIRVSIADTMGSIGTKTWTVTIVDLRVESTFDDSLFYNGDVTFRYTPYGEISKQVIFKLDGQPIGGTNTSASGRQMTTIIPAQNHGSHLFEVFMTADINGQKMQTSSLYKDIIWVEEGNTTPIIGCSVSQFEAVQYNATTFKYVVYDPQHNPANIQLQIDDNTPSALTVDRTAQQWSYRSSDIGEHTLIIKCGEVSKQIKATITALGIDINQVTTNLALDFNPSGKTNNDSDRIWNNGTYKMSVSSNFDWINGGYQLDLDGNTYFCVKAGTTASINYKLFGDDAKKNGKNFKVIFKSMNVRKYDAQLLSCHNGLIGLEMFAQNANLTSEQNAIEAKYVEETSHPIEFEFNIRPDSEPKEIITYEDGVPNKAITYSITDNFTQTEPQDIVIGSENCDVWIYRMKSYTMNLNNDEVIQNFIADGLNATDIINRYIRNDILNSNGELDPDYLAAKLPNVRIIKLSAPTFTTGKKNEVANTTVQHILVNGRTQDNWTATGSHKGQGTTSNLYGEAGRNIDINMSGGFTFADSSKSDVYSMTENSIGVNYFNIKVNIASSECANNAIFQDEYNTFDPYVRDAKKNNPMVRDTLEFHPCIVFIQETDTANAKEFYDGQYHFYACGNLGNSKKNYQVLGNDPTNPLEVIVEVCNNTSDVVRFKSADFTNETWDGETDFEWRYEMKTITDEQRETNKQNFIRMVTWVVNATPEVFVRDFEQYFVKDSILFYYLFTERYTMADNRAKNVFWHTIDGIHWDLTMDYDNDVAVGNNNEGALVLTYGLEDTDQIGTKDVFNAADSKLFCYVRDYMKDDLKSLYRTLENKEAWNANRLNAKFEEWQNYFPERLWIADLQRKYFRPYEDNGTTTYLVEMMCGRKKYQRIQFNTYQEKYISSKYMGSVCTNDSIMLRGYTPTNWKGVQPDGTLHIVPYADMYVSCMIGSNIVQIRAKRGEEYTIECPISVMNDTEMAIYTASQVQKIGDLSACYVGYCDLTRGEKLQELILGSSVEGYVNTNLTSFSVGNNLLLEKLNLQNLPNLAQSVDVSGCINLEEFYADGSGITGVIFAAGGKIRVAHIPAVANLTAKNLLNLTDLSVDSFNNLSTLVIENCRTIDIIDLLDKAPNVSRARLIGVSWDLDDTSLLDRLITLSGIDENGYNTPISVVSGFVHVPVMREKKLEQYLEAWKDIEIIYDSLINQFIVTFVNYDGTVLDKQFVDKGLTPVDPIKRTDDPINIPNRSSSISTDYSYSGWDSTMVPVFSNVTITAQYTESPRMYTVKYVSKGTVLQETKAPYATSVFYDGDNPVYTGEESAYKYYLFSHWDKGGYVTGDKTINAVYDVCEYNQGYFANKELSELRPVEIYTMISLGLEQENVSIKDSLSFTMGFDFTYDDIEENEIISQETAFIGNNYIDTEINLLDTDRDFILALDYKFNSTNSNNAVLAQCYQGDGSNGFKLWYSSQPRITWGTSSSYVAASDKRDMLIIRHVKGEKSLHIYKGNIPQVTVGYEELTSSKDMIINSNLVLGCAKADDGVYENYANGIIYWCKIWYADLGDTACKKLASWTHEKVELEMYGFKRYYLSDNSGRRSSMSFMSKYLLQNTMQLTNTTSNEGGWENYSANQFLNSRFYEAIPTQWKQLIKQVKISSTIGGESNEISTSNCYVAIPAGVEVDASLNFEPYSYEGSPISYITSNSTRKRAYQNGDSAQYWLRSPNVGYSSYVLLVDKDGSINYYQYGLYDGGIVPIISL